MLWMRSSLEGMRSSLGWMRSSLGGSRVDEIYPRVEDLA
jgi:hypothetical protein